MNQFDLILSSDAALSVFFYGSVAAMLVFGAFVSWARSTPLRDAERRLAHLARVTGR